MKIMQRSVHACGGILHEDNADDNVVTQKGDGGVRARQLKLQVQQCRSTRSSYIVYSLGML